MVCGQRMRSCEEPDIWPTALLESASKSPLSFQVTFAIAHIRLEKHKQIKTLHFCREKVFSYNLKCINEKWQKNIFQIQFLVHILYMYAISSLTPLLFQRANSIIQNPASVIHLSSVYLSTAVLILVAITHSSLQAAKTVTWTLGSSLSTHQTGHQPISSK